MAAEPIAAFEAPRIGDSAGVTDDEQVLEVFRYAFDCARTGDAQWLRSFVEAGGPVNLTNDKGDTLLILAAYHVQPAAVEALLELGAELDLANDNGQTALAAAAFRQSEPIIGMLLDAGADPAAGARSANAIAEFFQLPDIATLLTEPRPT